MSVVTSSSHHLASGFTVGHSEELAALRRGLEKTLKLRDSYTASMRAAESSPLAAVILYGRQLTGEFPPLGQCGLMSVLFGPPGAGATTLVSFILLWHGMPSHLS